MYTYTTKNQAHSLIIVTTAFKGDLGVLQKQRRKTVPAPENLLIVKATGQSKP